MAGGNERRRYIDLRDRFAASRRNVAEKYYDCLQCAEQCRHADNNPGGGNNNNNYSNNNNNNNGGGGGGGKNDKDGAMVVVNCIRSGYRLPAANVALYVDRDPSASLHDEIGKIRVVENNPGKASLMRHQSAHLTPVKKRSSLARPVRVHDSFVQPRRPMAEEEEEEEEERYYRDPQRDKQTGCKNPWWWQERREHQEPNVSSSSYACHRDAEEGGAGWPIRLRLEQMLELTLPQTKRKKKKKKKKKKTTTTATMMLMKQQQRSRHGSKDTERLLKVLSINNVDQDNRYNVKRCSVM